MAEEPVTPEAPQETAASEHAAETDGSPPAEQTKPARSLEDLEAELAKTRREAANYRVKLKEVEPIAKKAQEAAEAEKTEVQRANERAQAAEAREQATLADFAKMQLVVRYHLDPGDDDNPGDIDLLGSGTPEELEDRAQRIAAKNAAAAKATPPPTNQPVEGLRPGASPEPANPPDDSYPSQWKPAWLGGNEKDSRIIHGQ